MLGKLNAQFTAVQHGAVESVDSVIGISLVKVADKCESSAVLRVRVPRNVNIAHITILLENLQDIKLHLFNGLLSKTTLVPNNGQAFLRS